MERPRSILAVTLVAAACARSSPSLTQAAEPAMREAPSDGDCPEAYFAVSELEPPTCATTYGCVRIYQVTRDCTVTLRNTIEGVSGTLVWPSMGSNVLVVYETLVPTTGREQLGPAILTQVVVPSPLTTRDWAPDWKDITFGKRDPQGMLDWGFVSNRWYAYAIGCGDWEKGEAEWTCSAIEYLRHDGVRTRTAPVPALARVFSAGPIADGVALVKSARDILMCKAADELVELGSKGGTIVATSPRYGDRYFAYREVRGTRTSPGFEIAVSPMKGCHVDLSTPGWFSPGPGGLFAYAAPVAENEESIMRIYLKDSPNPLVTPDGNPFETPNDIVWAAP